jgi:exonuclease III
MIITSFNIRGVGGDSKFSTLKRVFQKIHPDIVFVQETICTDEKACEIFLKLFPGWEVCATSALGHSGGLCCIWNPKVVLFKSYNTCAGILLEGRIKGINEVVYLLNCYAPCVDRRIFWDRVKDCDILSCKNLIIGGDLNFTLNSAECWGLNAKMDALAEYFLEILTHFKLTDICTGKPLPTWRNGRKGDACINKRLD